jgi:hypothetical protein
MRRLLPSGGTILPLSSSQLLYTMTLLRLRRINQHGKNVAPAQGILDDGHARKMFFTQLRRVGGATEKHNNLGVQFFFVNFYSFEQNWFFPPLRPALVE